MNMIEKTFCLMCNCVSEYIMRLVYLLAKHENKTLANYIKHKNNLIMHYELY